MQVHGNVIPSKRKTGIHFKIESVTGGLALTCDGMRSILVCDDFFDTHVYQNRSTGFFVGTIVVILCLMRAHDERFPRSM